MFVQKMYKSYTNKFFFGIIQFFCQSKPAFFKKRIEGLSGLCNTGAGREVPMNFMLPRRNNVSFYSYFVSSGRLLLEGYRAFQSVGYCFIREKSHPECKFCKEST